MCELLHTSNHHYFDRNNKGPLYQCRASSFGRHARAGFSLRRLTCGSSLREGLWNHLLRCQFALLGKGVAFRKTSCLSLIPVSVHRRRSRVTSNTSTVTPTPTPKRFRSALTACTNSVQMSNSNC